MGLLASRSQIKFFKHNDMEDLDDLAEVSERVQGHGAAREAPGFTANLQVHILEISADLLLYSRIRHVIIVLCPL